MVNIDRLCADAESLIGKVPYTNRDAGESECTDLAKLQTGNYTTQCAGLIVAICKAQGLKVYNGTNTMWRTLLTDKGCVTDGKSSDPYSYKENPLSSKQLQKGMLVFKWSSGGEPTRYNKDGLGNYQHVGIVTSVNPLRIVHSTSVNHAGVTCDTKIGRFCAWGKLKGINYDTTTTQPTEGEEFMYKVEITTKSLRIRSDATTNSAVLGSLPYGTIVNCSAKEGMWYKLAESEGYIHAAYARVISESPDVPDTPDEDTTPVATEYVTRDEFNALLDRVEQLEAYHND